MRKLSTTIATFALIGLSSPAFAVELPVLPAENDLFVVECDGPEDSNNLQLFSVDPATGVTDEIGDGTGAATDNNSCASQGAQLPGTDWFYFVDWEGLESLDRINLVTGEHEEIGTITVDGAPAGITVSFTIGPDGTAYILDYDDLYTVNLETGAATYLSSPNFYDEYSGYPYGFAYDYKTEKFYVIEDADGALYELDPATGAKTELTYNEYYWTGSMSFDSDGNLWIVGSDDVVRQVTLENYNDETLWAESPDLESSGSGTLYSESVWVSFDVPQAELAETGFSPAPLFAGAALATAAGVAIVRARRRA